jgi:hypothetical protein
MMPEPRTRTAAEVADHAAVVLAETQERWEEYQGNGPMRLALALIERLAGQVEDLAAVVAEQDETVAALNRQAKDGPKAGVFATLTEHERRLDALARLAHQESSHRAWCPANGRQPGRLAAVACALGAIYSGAGPAEAAALLDNLEDAGYEVVRT